MSTPPINPVSIIDAGASNSITVDQLFNGAYRDAGLILFEQTGLSPDQTEEARVVYNRMVDGWRADGLMVSHLYRQLFPLVPGQGDYLVGPGGDFDIGWQDRLDRAGILLTNECPAPEYRLYPMTIDDYQDWTLKTQTTNWPRTFWYERAWPLAVLHLLYVPTDGNQIALYLEEFLLPIYATGDAQLSYQPGYQEAIESNLAVQIAARTPGSSISEDIRELARSSVNRIRNANNRPLRRDTDFSRGGGRSNVYAGNRWGNTGGYGG